MSTTKHVTVWCDVADCNQWEAFGHTATEARKEARQVGWMYRHGLDLCPQHAAEGVAS